MGLGLVLGHALMGVGKGKALVAADEMEARRSEALENLRAENDAIAREDTARLNDLNDARQVARRTDADLIKIDANAEVDKESDQRKHGYDKEMAQVTSRLRSSENAAQLRLADQLDRAARSGEVSSVEIDGGTGEKIIVFKDGRTQRTGVMATEKELVPGSYSGEPSALDEARGGGLGGGKTAPRPTAPAQPASKTYTQAEAAATAKKHGVSVDEVHRRMRAAGYKLAGQ